MKNLLLILLSVCPILSCLVAEDVDVDTVRKSTSLIGHLEKLQFQEFYSPKNFGAFSDSNKIQVRAIGIIEKSEDFPLATFMRGTVLVKTQPQSASTHCKKQTGFGDAQFLTLFLFQDGDWGRWGIGPIAIFPTATRPSTGQGKWQLGPAFGIAIESIEDWQFSLLVQNPITFAGDLNRPFINQMFFQPIITHHFGKGWYAKSDAEWTITWSRNEAIIPVNLGIGRVFDLWGQKVNLIAYSQWTAYHRNTSTAKYTVKIEFDLVFPR